MEGKQAKVIENAEGSRTTPSYVAFTRGNCQVAINICILSTILYYLLTIYSNLYILYYAF